MPKPKSNKQPIDKEEQVIIELIDNKREQLKALRKVLDHMNKEEKKRINK
jgi:CHASE3 domain sensor protein